MKIVLSFEEFKNRLQEQGNQIDSEAEKTFDWLARYGSLDAEDYNQLLESFDGLSAQETDRKLQRR